MSTGGRSLALDDIAQRFAISMLDFTSRLFWHNDFTGKCLHCGSASARTRAKRGSIGCLPARELSGYL